MQVVYADTVYDDKVVYAVYDDMRLFMLSIMTAMQIARVGSRSNLVTAGV